MSSSDPPSTSFPTHTGPSNHNTSASSSSGAGPSDHHETSSQRAQSRYGTSNPARMPESMPALKASLDKRREVMQGRQARGKDPGTGGKPNIELPGTERLGQGRVDHEWDSYEARERRKWAATILDTPELLSMWAEARNDTIPGTRYHFTKIMAGYED